MAATRPAGRRFRAMAYKVQALRDLLALARLLRRFAEDHPLDPSHASFLSAAVALEARAHLLAEGDAVIDLGRDAALHAPVDQLV